MTNHLTPEQTRRTAIGGWICGHPMLENCRTMYAQAIDTTDPGYIGGFGRLRHHRQPFTPAGTEVVTPNNGTPYSWAWLDLRTEPWVVSVPASGCYLLPFHDLDTTYVGFIESRSTGQGPGDYLLSGPGREGETPRGFAGVPCADTQIVGCLGRTYLGGAADTEGMCAVRDGYRLRPLSAFLGQNASAPAREPSWPEWREDAGHSLDFLTILGFLLGFFPVLPSREGLRERLAALGVDGRGAFHPGSLSPDARAAVEQGVEDARQQLDQTKARIRTSTGHSGTRDELGDDCRTRGCAADKGLYGLPSCEVWLKDSHGNAPPDAAKRDYTIHFAPGWPPPHGSSGRSSPAGFPNNDSSTTLSTGTRSATVPPASSATPTAACPLHPAQEARRPRPGARARRSVPPQPADLRHPHSALDSTWRIPDLVPHDRASAVR